MFSSIVVISAVVCPARNASVCKGHQHISVFADLGQRKVLFGTPGKDASVWERFMADLGQHNGHPHALTHVSMDMSRAYQKGVADY